MANSRALTEILRGLIGRKTKPSLKALQQPPAEFTKEGFYKRDKSGKIIRKKKKFR